jgi:hypothetical protein
MFVRFLQVPHDRSFQLPRTAVHAAAQLFIGERQEPAFHQIQPGATGRGEMHLVARAAVEEPRRVNRPNPRRTLRLVGRANARRDKVPVLLQIREEVEELKVDARGSHRASFRECGTFLPLLALAGPSHSEANRARARLASALRNRRVMIVRNNPPRPGILDSNWQRQVIRVRPSVGSNTTSPR